MPLTDRSTSRLGRSLVDGFTADRIVRTLVRIRKRRSVAESDKAALQQAAKLLTRVSQGDPVLGPGLDRRTLGATVHLDEETRLILQAPVESNVSRLRGKLRDLLHGDVPPDEDLEAIESFFIYLGQSILVESQSTETRPHGSTRLASRAWQLNQGTGGTISSGPRSPEAVRSETM